MMIISIGFMRYIVKSQTATSLEIKPFSQRKRSPHHRGASVACGLACICRARHDTVSRSDARRVPAAFFPARQREARPCRTIASASPSLLATSCASIAFMQAFVPEGQRVLQQGAHGYGDSMKKLRPCRGP